MPRNTVRITQPGIDGCVRQGHDIDANDFEVRAERLVGDASHVLYAFSIRAGERLLLEGRSASHSALAA